MVGLGLVGALVVFSDAARLVKSHNKTSPVPWGVFLPGFSYCLVACTNFICASWLFLCGCSDSKD